MRMSSKKLSGHFGKIIDDCNSTMDAMSIPTLSYTAAKNYLMQFIKNYGILFHKNPSYC